MRKKIFTLIIATMLVMSTTLVGCNNIDTNDIKETETETVVTDTETTESVTETVSEETTEVVEAVTEAVTEITEPVTETTETETKSESDVVTNNNKPKTESKATETTSKNTETVNKAPASTSTSNASSSGESNSKPAEHVHTWVDITEDVVVTDSPATTKQELVQEAWDETIVDEPERYENYAVFNYDGYRPTDGDDADKHAKELILAGHPANYHGETTIIPAVTHIEHHDAVYQTVEVPAVTHVETRVVGQKCSACGATK